MFISPDPEDPGLDLLLDILTNISHLLIVTNSSVNIVVYVLKVTKYKSLFSGPYFYDKET